MGDVETAIASPLSPVAMVAGPTLTAVLLPRAVPLPCALRRPALLLLPRGRLLLAALRLLLLHCRLRTACLLNRLLLLSLRGSLLRSRRLRMLLRLLLLRRFGFPLCLLSGLCALLLGLCLLLSRFGLPLCLLSGLCVLLRLRLPLLSRLGPLLLLRGLALLLFSRLCLAFIRSLLPRVQSAHRAEYQKQSGAGRSNKLHSLVSVKATIE